MTIQLYRKVALQGGEYIARRSQATMVERFCPACDTVHLLPSIYYSRPPVEKIKGIDKIHEVLEGGPTERMIIRTRAARAILHL